ncbi:MAG: hypothetical protein HZB55_02885 [Deltaproteobacteria bacterium]|nr:hypothetical protein [Deltaproteobacteria bacterium]
MREWLDELLQDGHDEKQFREHFFSLEDPVQQITDLEKWRRIQLRFVSSRIDEIRLLSGEQYSNIDHFLPELLQNADDNDYSDGVQPLVKLTLDREYFRLDNNEKGLTAKDLLAITDAAASTKIRKPTGASFIGEKGIGFKSVFSVADYVDIHSGPYSFRLNNDEFIIPHLIDSVGSTGTTGTQILLRLKAGNPAIPRKLSDRLRTLCESSQEFILFLQKVGRLEIEDRISSSPVEITVTRDTEKGVYVVREGGIDRTYRAFRYDESIPARVVRDRFRKLDADLRLDVIIAASKPATRNVPASGRLFCFLPTEVWTGTPLHVQIDAKTITNRANIADFAASKWNATIFGNLASHFLKAYVNLTKDPEFAPRLPEYMPYQVSGKNLGNDDIQKIMIEVENRLPSEALTLDRNGQYFPSKWVKMLPKNVEDILYEDKFERALSRQYVATEGEAGRDFGPEDSFTLLDRRWAKRYRNQMKSLGVEEVSAEVCIGMLNEGPPESVARGNVRRVRRFLTTIMDFSESSGFEFFIDRFSVVRLGSCMVHR